MFFFKLFIWFNLRQVQHHRWRALAVVLGIALGAAVFTGVRISVHASLGAFTRSMDAITGRADLVVTQPGGRVPEDLVARLRRLPGVTDVSPVMTTYTRPAEGGRPFLLVGIDPLLDRHLRDWNRVDPGDEEADWERLVAEPFTLLAGETLAAQAGWTTDARVVLSHRQGDTPFTVAGRITMDGLGKAANGRMAVCDIATFQEFTGTSGYVDRIDIRLADPGTDPGPELTRLMGNGLRLGSPGALKQSGQGMIRAYQVNLSFLSFTSLFVGMFLVYSLVALNAASRRHELAILRAVGASARSVYWLFIGEGALYGLAGWLVALPLGSFLVRYLLEGISSTISTLFVRVHVDRLALAPWEILISLGLTVAVAMLAAVQPAREAAGVPPREVMTTTRHQQGGRSDIRRLALGGLGCILLVLPLAHLPGVNGVPLPGYLASLLLFTGFALLAPWMLQQVGRRLQPLTARRAGGPAHLAAGYVRDSLARLAIAVGALITAVALFTALVVMVRSFRHTVEIWVAQTISGDLFVTTRMAETNRVWEPLPPEVVAYLAQHNEVALVPNRRFSLSHDGHPYQLEAMDFAAFQEFGHFFWLQGDDELIPRLIRGEGVLISEVFAHRNGMAAGDLFRTQLQGRTLTWKVLGVVRDYRTHGGVVFCSLDDLAARMDGLAWGGVRIFFRDRDRELDAAVARLRDDLVLRFGDRLDMMRGQALRAAVLRIFDETFAITTVLLIIALLVAALGIATILTMRVLERARELNTIYALGGSRGQIRRMILWEALYIVTVGEFLGLLCGFGLSYLLVFVINRQSFGWTFLYGVDWAALALSLPLIVATALLAALPAMRLAVKTSPAALLREFGN
ncbi:MAG: FtsX-like permease family protein [Desulfobacterales bacterium]|nr:FtsX-like permease family protein [Desulfobacterales bacterium]